MLGCLRCGGEGEEEEGRGRERKGEEGRGRKTKRKEEEEEGTNGMGERGWRGGQMRESHALCVRVDMSASYKI